MQNLDLRALEIFRAVAMEGSVSRAAERLNRVQSNVSTRIRQLEDRLQKRLFTRRNRGLELTPEGEMLLEYAERLLQLSAEAEDALNAGQPQGAFRLGTMESTAAARLPTILSSYHQRHPEVEIELRTDTAGGLVRQLLNHDVDAVFVAEPMTHKALRSTPVFEEKLVLVAPASFPPLRGPADIAGRTVIAFETGCAYRRYLDEWMLEAGVVPGGVIAMASYLGILASVAAGTGFAVVPQCVLDTLTPQHPYQYLPLSGKYAGIRTLLTWRAGFSTAKLNALKALLPAL